MTWCHKCNLGFSGLTHVCMGQSSYSNSTTVRIDDARTPEDPADYLSTGELALLADEAAAEAEACVCPCVCGRRVL